MGQDLLAGDDFDFLVSVQIGQHDRVEGGKLGLDPALRERAFAVFQLLLVHGQAILMGGPHDDVGQPVAGRIGGDDRMTRSAALELPVRMPRPLVLGRS